jgi:sulfatase maturation enzyme AslB (radical SAM superfamily)
MNQLDNSYLSSSDIIELLIESSGFCNAKCPHCPRYTDDGFLHDYVPEEHLTPDVLKNGLDPALLTNLRKVEFAGHTGDPMMNPWIEDLISFFNFVPLVTVDTNGGLRNQKWWKELARIPNLQVVWSIDGLEDTNHLYRIGVEYKKVMENSAAFIAAGGNAVWKCVVFKHNEHQIDEIKKLAESMGFSKVIFFRAYDYRFQGLPTWPVMVEGKFMHEISPSSLSQQQMKLNSKTFISRKTTTNSTRRSIDVLCIWAKQRQVFINVLGQLVPCCMMTHETTNDYIGKNIFKKMVGDDFNNISLRHHSMDYILKNYFSKAFNETLKNQKTMHPVCNKACGGLIHGTTRNTVGHREHIIKIDKTHESN